ncbi:MAG: AraC family transcriptional regulator [Victivallales bacterium]|jgi:AraC-like DNA-binding protein/quercetin dioxygenase-like cupin family protein|nr:AraC family transcriptional regulator [Victivallales bacterium]
MAQMPVSVNSDSPWLLALNQPENVRLLYWGYAEGNPSIHLEEHSHEFYQANFTLSGSCILCTEQGNIKLHNHDIVFIAPGVRHTLRYTENYLCYSCKFSAHLPAFPKIFHATESRYTQGIISAAKIILETTFPSRFFGVREGTVIMPQDHYQYLMEHFLTGVLSMSYHHRLERSGLLAKLYALLEKQEHPFVSVEEAAEACNYSRNHFSLLIQKETGMRAKDFLNEIRLESARRCLKYTDKSIGEISEILGFSSQFHFSDFFKRLSGISPKQYRNNLSGKKG